MIKRKTLEKRMEKFVLSDVEHFKDDFYVYDKEILDSMSVGDVLFWFTRECGTNTAQSKHVFDILEEHYNGRIRHHLFIKRVRGGFELVDRETFMRKHREEA